MQENWLWGFDQFINDITTTRGESMKDTPRTTLFNTFAVEGMELRDYFAAKALQGMLACDYSVDQEPAILAYEYADEMIKARAK